jgi:RNA polymerase-binding transcription factor DksA
MAKSNSKKVVAKKAVKKAPAKKSAAKKVVTKKSSATKKVATKKAVAKKPAKPAAKKAVVKKAVAKKPAAKKSTKVVAKASVKTLKAKPKAATPKTIVKKVEKKAAPAPKVPTKPSALLNNKPIATKAVKASKSTNTIMSEPKLKYSAEDLKEFEDIILEKLDTARKELDYIRNVLSRRNDEGTDNTSGSLKMLEDGAEVLEKESLSAMAGRLQKFILQLDNALARIKNGTYGICIVSGKLIPKERLRLVPHTQHTIEAKQQRL